MGGRSGEAAGGNFRLAAPGPGTAAGCRLGRRVRSALARASAAPGSLRGVLGRPVSAARLAGSRRGRVRRSQREAGKAREAVGQQRVPVRRNPARSWFPLGQSSRALSAMRHRGRSLLFSSGCRATRLGPSQVSTTAQRDHRIRRSRAATAVPQQIQLRPPMGADPPAVATACRQPSQPPKRSTTTRRRYDAVSDQRRRDARQK